MKLQLSIGQHLSLLTSGLRNVFIDHIISNFNPIHLSNILQTISASEHRNRLAAMEVSVGIVFDLSTKFMSTSTFIKCCLLNQNQVSKVYSTRIHADALFSPRLANILPPQQAKLAGKNQHRVDMIYFSPRKLFVRSYLNSSIITCTLFYPHKHATSLHSLI